MRQLPGRALLLLPLLLAGGVSEGLAATYTWIGGSGNWDTTSANWTGPQSTWPAASSDNDAAFGLSDADDSGTVDISDALRVLSYLFLGEETPPQADPTTCGEDPTEDELPCASPTRGC